MTQSYTHRRVSLHRLHARKNAELHTTSYWRSVRPLIPPTVQTQCRTAARQCEQHGHRIFAVAYEQSHYPAGVVLQMNVSAIGWQAVPASHHTTPSWKQPIYCTSQIIFHFKCRTNEQSDHHEEMPDKSCVVLHKHSLILQTLRSAAPLRSTAAVEQPRTMHVPALQVHAQAVGQSCQ